MFFTDFAGVGVPLPVLVVALIFAAVLLWFTFWAYRRQLPGGLPRGWVLLGSVVVCLALFLVNSTTNIWATFYNREEITVYRPYLPIYFPVESETKAPVISAALPSIFRPSMVRQVRLCKRIKVLRRTLLQALCVCRRKKGHRS